jgi:hypothetical protein
MVLTTSTLKGLEADLYLDGFGRRLAVRRGRPITVAMRDKYAR